MWIVTCESWSAIVLPLHAVLRADHGPALQAERAFRRPGGAILGAEIGPALRSTVRSEMNSEDKGKRVCFAHGLTSVKHAVLPALPRYGYADHPTQPIGLLPHL